MTIESRCKMDAMVVCPKCLSPNIYRWVCGEYTCQDCEAKFGEFGCVNDNQDGT